jgi:predicted enzyme related to lactoylglutathione lyase
MWPEQKENGVPTHWGSYVSVADIDEAIKKVKASGGEILVGPMDVFDAGRIASFLDPLGAVLSLGQPLKHIGARLVNEHGALCWNELMTNDTVKSSAFYSGLFG